MSTLVFTLLTFCPPAPPDRAKDTSTSSRVSFRGGVVSSPGSGIGRSSFNLGPCTPRRVSMSFSAFRSSHASSSSAHGSSSSSQSSSSQSSPQSPPRPYARTVRSAPGAFRKAGVRAELATQTRRAGNACATRE